MKHFIKNYHGSCHSVVIQYVFDVVCDLVIRVIFAYIILFLLVAVENPYFLHVRIQKAAQYRIAEGACAAGNYDGLCFEHKLSSYLICKLLLITAVNIPQTNHPALSPPF